MNVTRFLAFDVGTTSMKCILFNENFEELFYENREYDIESGPNGIAQIDPQVYYQTFCDCISAMRKRVHVGQDALAICFTTQGETLIPVDGDGNALTKAIVWLDTRAGKEANFIRSEIPQDAWYATTGLGEIDGALPMAKVLWLKENEPKIYQKTDKFLLLEDYLIFRLTGKRVSEKSLQSSTGWYDIVRERMYDKVLDLCQVDAEKFPEILPCGTVVGNICGGIAENLGLSAETVIVTGAMDQIASAIGAGNIRQGVVTETTGTALVVGATVVKPEFDLQTPLTVYKHYNDQFIYMPYFATAGITLKWFRDTMLPHLVSEAKEKGVSSYDLINEIAKTSPPGSNGVIMNPDLMVGGAFHGITLSTSMADLARSVMEGVAFMLRNLTEAVEAKGIEVDHILSMGGGSYSPLWSGIKASVCGKTIRCVGYSQTTALGAAILAAVAVGRYESVEAARKQIADSGRTYEPDENVRPIYDDVYIQYKNYI